MSTKDGGPAFPEACAVGPSGDVYDAYPGMSLRDWFGGQALAGMAAAQSGEDFCLLLDETAEETGLNAAQTLARFSYCVADAMLAAREGEDAA